MGWIQIAMMIIQLIQFIWPWLAKWLNLEKQHEKLAKKLAQTADANNAMPSFSGPNDVKRFADLMFETSKQLHGPLRLLARRVANLSRTNPERIWNAAVQQGKVGGTTVPEPTFDQITQRQTDTIARYGLSAEDTIPQSSEGTMSAPASDATPAVAEAAPQTAMPMLTFSFQKFLEVLFAIPELLGPMSFVFSWLGIDKLRTLLLGAAPDIKFAVPMNAGAMPPDVKEQVVAALRQLAGLFTSRPLVVLAINTFITFASGPILDAVWDKIMAWLNGLSPVPTPVGPSFGTPEDAANADPLGIVALI